MPNPVRIMGGHTHLMTGTTHPAFANAVAKRLHMPLIPVNAKRFPVGEVHIKVGESVRGDNAIVLATANTGRIDSDFMETKVLLQTLSLASCKDIHLFMTAMPYLRQDRKDEPRVPITAVMAFNEINQAARGKLQSMTIFDPHTIGAEAIMTAVGIPAPAALTTRGLFVDFIKKSLPLDKVVLLAPDSGRVKWVRSWAKAIYGPEEYMLHYLGAEKDNIGDDQVVYIHERNLDLKIRAGKWTKTMHTKVTLPGKIVVVVDDMIDGGKTSISAAVAAAKRHPAYLLSTAVHGYLSGKAPQRLQGSPFDQVFVTNTLNIPSESRFPKLNILDVSPLVAGIISRIMKNESLQGYNLSI